MWTKGYTLLCSYDHELSSQAFFFLDGIIEIALIPGCRFISLGSLVHFNVTERCFPIFIFFFLFYLPGRHEHTRSKKKEKCATPTPILKFFCEPRDFFIFKIFLKRKKICFFLKNPSGAGLKTAAPKKFTKKASTVVHDLPHPN